MKKVKYYAAISFLTSAIVLTSCSAEVKQEESVSDKATECIISISDSISQAAETAINERIEREREEKAAFEKAVTNPDFVDTPEFASVNRVTITWNDVRQSYIVECSSGNATYTVNLPEVRLVSYMLRKCNCEYLYLHNLSDASVLEELTVLKSIKEISIYDAKFDDLDILRKYTTLEGVRLENCASIKDISFFEDLPNIIAIDIKGTRVHDLTPLSNATNLTSANLRCNEITNPEVLGNLPNLSILRLEYNKIENISQLKTFIERNIFSEDMANSIIKTSTNHAVIFTSSEENTGVSLSIAYYDAQKEYYAEALDSDGSVIAFLFTDEPYNFYDISKKISEQKYLSIKNFPEDGYIHHLNHGDDFETVEVYNCNFDKFYMPDNVVNLTIYNCPNLTGEFHASGMPCMYTDLKYIGIKNTGITSVEDLNLARYLESAEFEDNKMDNYDFLLDVDSLKNATVTIDNPNMDTSVLDNLRESGVEVFESDGIEATELEQDDIPMGVKRAR